MKPIVEYVDDFKEMMWLIKRVYESDEELISKYHIKAGFDLEDCVIDTMERLTVLKKLEFFSLWDGAELLGYFGIRESEFGTELITFAIMPKQRRSEVLIAFWNTVKNIAGNELICGLYSRNKPAIEFIKKLEYQHLLTGNDPDENNEEYQIFSLKINEPCRLEQLSRVH